MPLHDFSFSEGAWRSFTAEATGWSSISAHSSAYVVIGNLCFVYFFAQGTSNSSATTIALPIASVNFFDIIIRAGDNSTFTTNPGLLEVNASTVGNCYKSQDGAGWTASGTKSVSGQFFYPIALS
jgi:hypothetical protein